MPELGATVAVNVTAWPTLDATRSRRDESWSWCLVSGRVGQNDVIATAACIADAEGNAPDQDRRPFGETVEGPDDRRGARDDRETSLPASV